MNLSGGGIKRRYFDARNGWVVIAPLFGLSNFVILLKLELGIDLPIYLFYPIILVPIVTALIITGHTFRKQQFNTDLDLTYVRASEAGKSVRIMMDSQYEIMKALKINIPPEFIERRNFMEMIEQKKVK